MRAAHFRRRHRGRPRRLYAVRPEPLQDVDAWLGRFRRYWTPRLAALATEIERGKRQRRDQPEE